MLETIKTIGAFVGLLTGIIFFYDRLSNGRPIASLTIIKDGTRKLACIRISNASAYDIAILDATVNPEVYFLAESLEIRNVLEGAAGQKPSFMLKPGESKDLIIAPKFRNGTAIEVVEARNVQFWIFWRRGNSTWWPQVPVWVWTSTTTIRKYGLETAE